MPGTFSDSVINVPMHIFDIFGFWVVPIARASIRYEFASHGGSS